MHHILNYSITILPDYSLKFRNESFLFIYLLTYMDTNKSTLMNHKAYSEQCSVLNNNDKNNIEDTQDYYNNLAFKK